MKVLKTYTGEMKNVEDNQAIVETIPQKQVRYQ